MLRKVQEAVEQENRFADSDKQLVETQPVSPSMCPESGPEPVEKADE